MALVQILPDPDFSEISPISAHFGLVVGCRNVWRGLTATRWWSFRGPCVVIRHADWNAPGRVRLAGTMLSRCPPLVCKPLWTPHANGLALRVAYFEGAMELGCVDILMSGHLRLLPCPHLQGLHVTY